MPTGSNAVVDLVRQTSTRRLETDPGDDALFQSRDSSSRNRWPRGTVNWGPPPPEPVTHPPAPVKQRTWMLKLGVLAIAVVTGVAVAMIGFSTDSKVVTRPAWTPPPLPVVAAPIPEPQPVVAPPTVTPVPPPTEPTIASPTEPTIAPSPTIDETPPVVEPRPAKVTKAKRRVHAEKKRIAKAKHVAIAPAAPTETTAPTATTKTAPAGPVRRSAQAHDNENPL